MSYLENFQNKVFQIRHGNILLNILQYTKWSCVNDYFSQKVYGDTRKGLFKGRVLFMLKNYTASTLEKYLSSFSLTKAITGPKAKATTTVTIPIVLPRR